jgi:murein DD-endopeptidase MepM/ murein hydrolase activator NlpD
MRSTNVFFWGTIGMLLMGRVLYVSFATIAGNGVSEVSGIKDTAIYKKFDPDSLLLLAELGTRHKDVTDSTIFKPVLADSTGIAKEILAEINDTLPPASVFETMTPDSIIKTLDQEVMSDNNDLPAGIEAAEESEFENASYNSTEYLFKGNKFIQDPTFDTISIFDPVNVNPYHVDFSKKTDTTVIYLNDAYCSYAHPFSGHITSPYGPRWRRFHKGVDIKLNTGDSVRCAFEGLVRVSHRSRSFGNVVMVRHKNGLETVYAHLSKLTAGVGQHVEAGDIIGLGGNTGHSFGSHLHFEVRYKGEPINPGALISFEENCLYADTLAVCKNTFSELSYFIAEQKRVKWHTIRNGESLGTIARKHHTSITSLCRLNKISRKTVLRVGRKLRYV